MKKKLKFIISLTMIWVYILAFSLNTQAQLNPLGTSYYGNQYLNNPAMAGIDKGLSVNLAYRRQWSTIPGGPASQSVTADYGFTNKAGIGLSVYNDKSGLQKWTRAVATYSYHLPLSNESQLHFGISFGFSHDRLSEGDVNADPKDVSVERYNQRETLIDGDFGLAYTSGALSVQAALPNMKTFFKRNEYNYMDGSSLFISGGYTFNLSLENEGATLQPKVNFRGVKGYHNIIDLGVNLGMIDNQIQLFGLYHTSQSITFGFGFQYMNLNLSGMYTSETSDIQGYTNGSFELGLKITSPQRK